MTLVTYSNDKLYRQSTAITPQTTSYVASDVISVSLLNSTSSNDLSQHPLTIQITVDADQVKHFLISTVNTLITVGVAIRVQMFQASTLKATPGCL